MNPDEEKDIERKIAAENSLAHLQDQARLIESRANEAHRLLEPIRLRKRQNHYMQEAIELMNRRIREKK